MYHIVQGKLDITLALRIFILSLHTSILTISLSRGHTCTNSFVCKTKRWLFITNADLSSSSRFTSSEQIMEMCADVYRTLSAIVGQP